MNRIIKHLLLLMVLGIGLTAFAQNTMAVSSSSGHPQDEVTLSISIENTDSFVAFQTEIPLGDNLQYVANSAALTGRSNGHQLSATVLNKILKIYAYSFANAEFSGNSGDVLTFRLKLLNEPGDNAVNLAKAKIADAAGNSLALSTTAGNVTILSPKAQVTNPVIDYGRIPIRSTYNSTLYVRNSGNEPLTVTGLQFSDATLSCPSFTETVIQSGGTAPFNIKFAPMVSGSVNYTITVVSNAINGSQAATVTAEPYSVNELHVANTSGYCDETVSIDLNVNNMDAIVGLQFKFKMPSALKFVANSVELTSRQSDHVAVGSMRNDTLIVMAYSPSNTPFSGEDGKILSFDVQIDGQYGNYYLYPHNVILSDNTGTNVTSDTYSGYVNVRSPRMSCSSSFSMGETPLTETLTKDFNIYNQGNAQLRIESINFTNSCFSVSNDLPVVIEQYASTNIHVSYKGEIAGDVEAIMQLYTNDPDRRLFNVNVTASPYEPNALVLSTGAVNADLDVNVNIDMDNYSDITAIQTDFTYPSESYTLNPSDFHLGGRCASHTISATRKNKNTFRIIIFSMSNSLIADHEGTVVYATMHRNANVISTEFPISASNIVMSSPNGTNMATGDDPNMTFSIQSKAVSSGWNWISTDVETSGGEGLGKVLTAVGSNGTYMKSQYNYIEYIEGNWYGLLSAVENEQMYMLQMSSAGTLNISGAKATPSSHPIQLSTGWTWVGYPSAQSAAINTALSGLSAKDGDYIKSQSQYAEYVSGYGWVGTLSTMQPGEGYMYRNTGSNAMTLTYNTTKGEAGTSDTTEFHWNPDIHQFPDNMTATSVISINGEEVRNGNFEVGAFCGDECRGSARALYIEPFDRYIFFLTLHGQENDVFNFRLYDIENDVEMEGFADNQVIFHANATEGSVTNPYVIEFQVTSVVDESDFVAGIHPNPVGRGGAITVSVNHIAKVEIFDAIGRKVSEHTVNGIGDISSPKTSGVYFIRMTCGDGMTSCKKIIVK
ncbi:MAG: DUF1573 domain-containing protein [Bacteroidales bacterium]|nr:DUF1573 domain-containing protein [Bacteroidales bacterium]